MKVSFSIRRQRYLNYLVSRSGYGSSDGSCQESSVGLDHEIGNGSDGDSAGQDRVLDIDDVELPAETNPEELQGQFL